MEVVDVVHMALNVAAPAFTLFSLVFLLPPFLFFKLFLSLFRNSLLAENVAGKVVLITGASSGIGEEVAYEYARRGAYLVVGARRKDRLTQVAEKARELGSPDVLPVSADVSDVDHCKRLVDQTIQRFGRLDHLVNNAGVISVCMFEESTDLRDLRPVLDINFWGSVYMTRFAIPHLRESKGKIIAVASTAAWLPTPRMSIYNASKAALMSLYETLRVEFGSDVGITIVTPGFVESEMTQGKFLCKDGKMEVNPELRDAVVSAMPVGRVESCAKAIVKAGCGGERYLTEPAWYGASYYWKVLWPEVVEWCFRVVTSAPHTPAAETLTKKMLDLTGARTIFHPHSIQSPRPNKAD
ncbi:11-beta-hydroxysteroid dehydrogenase A-like [Malania oleifera]|uniref:11-beta-hydroxysteroid dehydrogenase A-like n=1 Tax=Malania oleifera TaxID=397392 RepID=UPI0025ADB66D|nr:11-beta-hydroxysteroid dehydrogenase A-like [Malania oleifera]